MTRPVRLIELGGLAPAARAKLLQRAEADLSAYIEKVRPVIEAVRTEGDEALARFAREFDKAPLTADAIAATKGFRHGLRPGRPQGRRGHRIRHRRHPPFPRGAEAGGDVAEGDPARRLRRRADDAHRLGRLLRPARQGRLSQRGHDDGGAGRRRRGAADRCPHPVRAGRQGRCREPDRRKAGGRGAGL